MGDPKCDCDALPPPDLGSGLRFAVTRRLDTA